MNNYKTTARYHRFNFYWIVIPLILIMALIGLFIYKDNLANSRQSQVKAVEDEISEMESNLSTLDIAISYREKVDDTIGAAKFVLSRSEMSQGMNEGWITGCADENSSDCKALKACNIKMELIKREDKEEVRKNLVNLSPDVKSGIENWLDANRIIGGPCIAGYWMGEQQIINRGKEATDVLIGHKSKITKELSDKKEELDKLYSDPYFLWFTISK